MPTTVTVTPDMWSTLDGAAAPLVDDPECPSESKCAEVRWTPGGGEVGLCAAIPPVDIAGPVLIRLEVRADDVVLLQGALRTHAGQVHVAPIGAAKRGWRELTMSSHAFVAAGPGLVDGADMAELRLSYAGPGEEVPGGVRPSDIPVPADGTVIRIGRVTIEAQPPVVQAFDYTGPATDGGAPISAVEPHPQFAIHLDFKAMQTPEAIEPALARGRSMGFGMLEAGNATWAEFEPRDGEWTWGRLDPYADAARSLGMRLDACCGSLGLDQPGFELNRVHIPADLRFDGDYTALLPRYQRFLDQFFQRYGDVVTCFTLHSEGCTRYFARHGEEVGSYRDFVAEVVQYIHGIAPGVDVGTCIENYETPSIIETIHAATDVAVLLFQPGQGRTHASWIPEQFARILDMAGDKRVAFNETFVWSSTLVGANESEQAAGVEALFEQLVAHRDRIAWVSWWGLHDDSAELWDTIGRSLTGGEPSPAGMWIGQLYTCGLLRPDGTVKPAGRAFMEGIEAFRRG